MKKILTSFIIGIIAGAVILFFVNEKCPVSGIFKGDKPVKTESSISNSTEFLSISEKLEKGGDLFAYLNTSKIIDTINRSLNTLKDTITDDEKMDKNRKAEAEKWFKFITGILNKSGLLEISGIGVSSIEVEKGLTRSKFVIQHDPGEGNGLLWNTLGKNTGDLSYLDLLPEETVLSSFSDTNYFMIWKWLKEQAERFGDDKIRFSLTSIEKDLKDNGIDLKSLLGSINGETGIIITMDKENMKEYTAPHKKIKFPDPGVALVISTSNDSIFKLLSEKIPGINVVEKDGVKSIDIKAPKMPFTFAPQIVQSDNMMILGSRPDLIVKILKGSGNKSIRNSEEFKKLSKGMPDSGNGFTYLSSAFFREFMNIQKELSPGDVEAQNKGMEFMKKIGLNFENLSVFRIIQKTSEGYTITTNSTMKMEMMMIMPAVAAGGVIAAVMIPQLIRKRAEGFNRGVQPLTPPSREL